MEIAAIEEVTSAVLAKVPVVDGRVIVAEPYEIVPVGFILKVSEPPFIAEKPLEVCTFPVSHCTSLLVALLAEPAVYLIKAIGISPLFNSATVAVLVFALPVTAPSLKYKLFRVSPLSVPSAITIKPYQSLSPKAFAAMAGLLVVIVLFGTETTIPSLIAVKALSPPSVFSIS